ncbi:uncharacterized protein ASCRUDRAFT_53907 [Ascoidea rubescens DSM 1968]|uniref:Uncharacterized protein n=1 Tax=Ascoidea rubescens DSM 1968 TaxID=1344418 RepID=A0A1D2VS10_9ASCO|nr:hypothetical protein ASCRUDRAFT_53907 [Ascoidea rubescens DSM 1968]ODV64357.1 hypothetical protein ASCRUDRAFT_53907 [Ascoidea rubescens DSM 1968]
MIENENKEKKFEFLKFEDRNCLIIYKLLFLTRNSESFKSFNENLLDPSINSRGKKQCERLKECWIRQIDKGCPLPSLYYSSPLRRSIDTLIYTWNDITSNNYQPIIYENLRPLIELKNVNKRHNKSDITQNYPNFILQNDFSEEDLLFEKYEKEAKRSENVIEFHERILNFIKYEIFEKNYLLNQYNSNSCLSINCNLRTIQEILKIMGHRPFHVEKGELIPVLIKGTREPTDSNNVILKYQ